MMVSKSTSELMDELMKSNNLELYLKENSQYLVRDEISVYLSNILENKGLVKSAVIKKTELSEVTGYQILAGTRKPSRDSLICICVAMELGLEEIQSLLKAGGFAALYPKNERDAIIISGICGSMSVAGINELLFDNNESTLNK